jgi:hypothetical protein
MSILSDIEAKLGVDETAVVNFFSTTLPDIEQKIEADVEFIAGKFNIAVQWMGAHGQEIATDVLGLIGIAATAGIVPPAAVLAAAAALNSAVSLVNIALAAQQKSQAAGATNLAQAIAAGGAAYLQLKTAQIATAQAQAHVAAPSVVPVPAVPVAGAATSGA